MTVHPNVNLSGLAAIRHSTPWPRTDLRGLQTKTVAELAAFTPALLAKAFRGELTLQNLQTEPTLSSSTSLGK